MQTLADFFPDSNPKYARIERALYVARRELDAVTPRESPDIYVQNSFPANPLPSTQVHRSDLTPPGWYRYDLTLLTWVPV